MTDDLFDAPDTFVLNELPKDQYGRYKLPDPTTGKITGRTRVTTFAKSISDTFALNQWGLRMAMRGLVLRRDLYALVASTPDDQKERLNQIAEDAKSAASARAAANLGTAMHTFSERLDKGEALAALGAPPELSTILAARQKAVRDHQIIMVPDMIERTVYVPDFDICGTLDRWAHTDVPNGDPGRIGVDDPGEIVDDKTGRDLSYGQVEIAIQLACYARASHVLNRAKFWEAWRRAGGTPYKAPKTMDPSCWEPMPATRLDRALVIHMPVAQAIDAPTAPPVVTVYEVDIAAGWEAAQLCRDVREWRKRKGLFTALTVTAPVASASQPPVRGDLVRGVPAILASENPGKSAPVAAARADLETREPTWLDRIRAARSRADLSQVWREAAAKGEWTAELETAGKDQLAKFESPLTTG